MINPIFDLTKNEFEKQRDTLNLIASENYPSPKVLQLLGSVWSNKYAEGYPGKRYYAGNQFTDKLETFVQEKALQIFDETGEYGVNVQTLSGSPANATVYLTVLEHNDTILSMNLANGGHLSHLHTTSNYKKFFNHVTYDVRETTENGSLTYELDLEDFENKLKEHRPKLVIIGFSAYPRAYNFGPLCKLAHKYESLVLADIAHINGLVAAKLHDSPFKKGEEGADFITMTTHKTFRGPRAAMIFAKNYIPKYTWFQPKKQIGGLIEKINKTIFPGTSGGPHMNKIAAIGQACLEILGEDNYPDNLSFVEYSTKVIKTCKALENGLFEGGLEIISPTQNHLCLVKLPQEIDSWNFQNSLEEIGIITNRNSIPFDTKKAMRPSGMRFGTAALTSRGLNVEQAFDLGKNIALFANKKISEEEIKLFVQNLLQNLSWYYKN